MSRVPGLTDEGRGPPSVMDREDGCVFQIREEVYPRPQCRVPNAAGKSATVAAVASSCGVPIPTGSLSVWGWEVLGCVSNRGVGSSTLMLPRGVRFGGVTGPRGDV